MAKNPHLWNKLSFVRAVFPDARLIVTARDIRSTVASLKYMWSTAHARYGTRYYLPVDTHECWRITKGDFDAVDKSRVFPDGGIEILADYWLRTYEEIGRVACEFEIAVRLLHQDLVADSRTVLGGLYDRLGLRPVDTIYDLQRRNTMVDKRLTPSEHRLVDRFIQANLDRIEALSWADTSL